jgi:hypothetical protein
LWQNVLLLVVGGHSHETKQEGAFYSIQGQFGLPNLGFGGRCQEAGDIAKTTPDKCGESPGRSVEDANKKV